MKCRELVHILETLCPVYHAEKWDNPGLIAGDFDKEIKKVYIALDATTAVIDDAISKGADMILTHHPLVFSGMKKINTDDFTGRRLIKMIKNDICCYAMHTNFDVDVMAELAADRLNLSQQAVLEITRREQCGDEVKDFGIGRTGMLPEAMTLAQCAAFVKKAFDISDVRIFGNPETVVHKAALCPGSGKDLMMQVKEAQADVYITGDIGHHNGIDANEDGIMVVDAGHQGMEYIFIDYMKDYILEHCQDVCVETETSFPPFMTV